ncbi:hypothetical protein P9027_29790 [Bacillus thuringiensis]|uniref:type III toxin-antitoxin system TenpIN family toxin n=1 Tax=Bacillus thuringiensis TaxID=1428 RepID=UPI002DB6E7BB|nr:hypothetical protein [Bacillus thuringiensis]MEC3226113.1 hypothetical protein [Bacillus thuringiensis]MEC3463195.1 hypothetical protein [Bacillus thuringiensis]MEC3555394.1 hypothetical protein [Bacillus thuringiensis]MED2058879.1 hypothetical protein [Bacillus thuringiensis]
MTKKIEVVHLNKKYFDENSHFKNMLDENNVSKQMKRPYVYVKVRVEDKDFLLPLRSNLNHPNGFHAPSSKSANAGIDYSHALILSNRTYIKNQTHLDREQYNFIKDNYETIKSGFGSYLKDYIRQEKKGIAHKIGKFKHSTLLNFNQELGLVKEKESDKENKLEKPTIENTEEIEEGHEMKDKDVVQEKKETKIQKEMQAKSGQEEQEKARDKQREQARRQAYMRQMGRER